MARYFLISGRGIAKKIRYATHGAGRQISELGAEARAECPNCKSYIDNSDVDGQWPGLPDGVKFDPSDEQLLQHLESKIGHDGLEPHPFIDEFITTVENEEGICYTHPENLPGMKKDGSIVHFFHRVPKAYGCGQRKRRRVTAGFDDTAFDEHWRWHKTGRSKAIHDNGVRKGWKKFLVLYRTSQRDGKAERAPWVMHQYHLGEQEDEKEGELVVSKVFYQLPTKHTENVQTENVDEAADAFAAGIGPNTPKTSTPQPPRRANNSPCKTEQNASILLDQDEELTIPIVGPESESGNPAWCTREPLSVGEESRAQPSADETLLCLEDPACLNEFPLDYDYPILSQCRNEVLDSSQNTFHGLPDLNNVDLGIPPDGHLSDIQFGSQESIGSWLDRF